jgi:hypothetical protein
MHGGGKSHQHSTEPIINSSINENIGHFVRRPSGRATLIALAFLIITSAVKRKLSKLDFVIFTVFTITLSVFDSAKESVKVYLNRLMLFRDGILKHSIPSNKNEKGKSKGFNYLFNNENLADRVTLLGIAINIILSVSKFFGGIGFSLLFYRINLQLFFI